MLSQNSETYIGAPKENAQESILELNLPVNEHPTNSGATFSNQNHNEQVLDLNSNEKHPEMPQHNDSNKLVKVYERRDHKKGDEGPILQPCQESEPRDDPSHCPNPGKSSIVPECHGKSTSIPKSLDSDLDIPITIRKPVRSCTKYPMSKFVSYSNLSSSFVAFTSQLSSIEIPKNVQEALKVPKWKESILEEMGALEKNKTRRF